MYHFVLFFSDDLVAQEPTAVEVGADGEKLHLEPQLPITEPANQHLQTMPNIEAMAKMILNDLIEAMFDDQDNQPIARTIAKKIIDDIIKAMFDNNNTGNLALLWLLQFI